MHHTISNSYVEFADKDHARREVDEIVRTNGRWLIKVRDVAPKDQPVAGCLLRGFGMVVCRSRFGAPTNADSMKLLGGAFFGVHDDAFAQLEVV